MSKEIPGINVPLNSNDSKEQDRENDRGKGIWGVPGIGTPVSSNESSIKPKKNSFLRDALLNASGVVSTDPALLEIQERDRDRQRLVKADKRATRAEKKEKNRLLNQEKKAATTKTKIGLFELLIGAATGNAVITAKGVGDSVDGMADTMKARQKKRSARKNPGQSSTFVDLANIIFDQKKTSTVVKQKASQKPSREPSMNGMGNNVPQNNDIIEGEFTIIDDGKQKQLPSGKKS